MLGAEVPFLHQEFKSALDNQAVNARKILQHSARVDAVLDHTLNLDRHGHMRHKLQDAIDNADHDPATAFQIRSGKRCCRQHDAAVGANVYPNALTSVVRVGHPTLPSSEIEISFCASTANSIGNCCSTSLTKPLTTRPTASSWLSPRCTQ